MDFLNDLIMLIGIGSILGILCAVVYAVVEVRAMSGVAERYEDHLKAIRRDIRLVAILTLRAREEARSSEFDLELGDARAEGPTLAERLNGAAEDSISDEPIMVPESGTAATSRSTRKLAERVVQPKLGPPRLTPRSATANGSSLPHDTKLGPKASTKKKKKKKQKKAAKQA